MINDITHRERVNDPRLILKFHEKKKKKKTPLHSNSLRPHLNLFNGLTVTRGG